MTHSDETAAAGAQDYQPPTMAAGAAAEGETQSINAWSLEDASEEVTPYEMSPDAPPEVELRSWRIPVLVAVAMLIALAIGGGFWWKMSQPTPATAPSSVAPSPASQTPDQRFADLLRQQGVAQTGTDAQAAMSARQICSGLTSGQFTFAQAVTGIEKGAGVSNDNATRFAQTAIDVYCPGAKGAS